MTDQLKHAITAAKTAQNHTNQTTDNEQAEAISRAGEQTFDMSETTYKTSHTAVRKARRFAMQGLYEWLVTDRRFDTTGKLGWKDNAPHDIAARTRATNAMHTVHIGYYHEMMRDIPEQIEALDALISQHLDREIDKLDTVEHAILLIGAYELQNRLEIPYKVVMDEAMKLNNHFGATDAHKLINAVLDRMAIELRAIEVEADSKANKRNSQKSAAAQLIDDKAKQAANVETDNQPKTSDKPRISANKTGVKRNRPNKPNSGTATKQATKNMAKPVATEQSMEMEMSDNIANIDHETNPTTVDHDVKDTTLKTDSVVEKDKPLENTNEADIGLESSNLLSSEDKASKAAEEKDNNSDTKD